MATERRLGPCATCGQEHREPPHHIEPRGRRPDLREDPANLAPLCRRCHDKMIPGGPWKVIRDGEFWRTFVVATGETVSRRPIEGDQSQALSLLNQTADLVDPRDPSRKVLTILSRATDFEVRAFSEYAGRVGRNSTWLQKLAWWEARERWPFKEGTCEHGMPRWAHDLAPSFDVAEKTFWEGSRAAAMFADDDGSPLPSTSYVIASHAKDPKAALVKVRELHEDGRSTREQREAVGVASGRPGSCTCDNCGHIHTAKKETVG